MQKDKPLKRHPSLQPFSRDHHHALLLCWKIRQGLSKNIPPNRILNYTLWVYNQHIEPHFQLEEKYMFPVLDNTDKLVAQALKEHAHLRSLFQRRNQTQDTLESIANDLTDHIRFEERVLFPMVQIQASPTQLVQIRAVHQDIPPADNWSDPFWE